MKRFLALFLCLVMVFALFSVSASAAYSTTSNRGDDLVYPNARDYYAAPWAAQVLAFKENGAIYIMPMPEPGHGNLGTVRSSNMKRRMSAPRPGARVSSLTTPCTPPTARPWCSRRTGTALTSPRP